MGNWPSISRVVRRIDPASKTAWLVSSEIAASPAPSEERIRASSRSARAGMLASSSPPSVGLQLGPLDRQPVGVGGDHRHLAAAGGDEDAGQHRAHVVARGGAGDQLDARFERRRPGSSAAARPRLGELREVLGRQHPQVEAGAAAADLDVALGLARLDLHASASASERATSASSRPGQQHRARRPRPRRRASVSRPRSRSVAREASPVPPGAEQDTGERLGRGAGRDGSGDDRELGDELFSFGRELQVMVAFLSWIRTCGKSLGQALILASRCGFRAVDRRCGQAVDSCSAGGCRALVAEQGCG